MSSFSHIRNLEPEISCLDDRWCIHRVIWAPGISFIWSSCFLELATQVWNLDKAVSGVYMYVIVRRRVKETTGFRGPWDCSVPSTAKTSYI